jgi:sugar/nucleoside kinase (ribokinase family)
VADLLGRPIDALPPKGKLSLVDSMSLQIGGCASNTAVDLARLGVKTSILGKVGRDGLGDFLVQTLERAGLDTRGVVRDENVGTSSTMVLVSGDGERSFIHYIGANAHYVPDDVDWVVVRDSRILHIAGALVMPGLDGPPMADILRRAKSEYLITSLDTVWDAKGRWMKSLRPCLPYTDYFLPSIAEAQEISGQREPKDVARALRDAGAKTVGLKLGEDGCYVQTADEELQVPAFTVSPVDGTGTGDAWDAGFLCGVLNRWDLERTARFANAVGALCVTGLGATCGVRSLAETEEFIRKNQPL